MGRTQIYAVVSLFSFPLFPHIFKHLSGVLVHYQVPRLYYHGNTCCNPKVLFISLSDQLRSLYFTDELALLCITSHFSTVKFVCCFIARTQAWKAFLHSLQVAHIFTTLINLCHSPELSLKLTFRL